MSPAPTAAAIVDVREAARRVEAWRQQGRTVALANGCFDLLHAGHARYLRAAAAEADRLVVGVNGDDAVRWLKGSDRPVLTSSDRAAMVAAIRGVDLVVVFPERTADELIRQLRPDVHCKGTDYADGVPEAATAAAVGARVAIVGDPKRRSSRGLLAAIRGES